MKKRTNKKRKHHQPSENNTTQQPIDAGKQSEVTPLHRIVENALQHVRDDHRIPSAALLGSGQLNFNSTDLNENDPLNTAEEIFD